MFESFGWLTGRTRRSGCRQDGAFRSIETRRGTYFVHWDPDAVGALIESEGLRADDLDVQGTKARQRLARDLFLLGLKEDLAVGSRPAGSPISRLARSLVKMERPSVRMAPAAARFSPAT